MITVCRGGSSAAGDTASVLRSFTSSRAANWATSHMFSVPVTLSSACPRVYALAAAVHLAAVTAAAEGGSRASRWRSAVAAIHAGGGCRGGRGGQGNGRAALLAMPPQGLRCCRSKRTCLCTESQSTQHDRNACAKHPRAARVLCKDRAQLLQHTRTSHMHQKHCHLACLSPNMHQRRKDRVAHRTQHGRLSPHAKKARDTARSTTHAARVTLEDTSPESLNVHPANKKNAPWH